MAVSQQAGGSLQQGAAPVSVLISRDELIRLVVGVLVVGGVIAGAYALNGTPGYGAPASFSLLTGLTLGILFERGRFCFFCILRDFIEHRGTSGIFAILAALTVGMIGYAIVFGAFLPNTSTGRLPPGAHIGPVSWILVAAGLAFGVGMALSGACISGHLYRLGEGYTRAPLALFGALVGFGLGFYTWQSAYLGTIRTAPVAWLPGTLGYGGALAVSLAVIAVIAIYLLRFSPQAPAREAVRITPAYVFDKVFRQRWNPLVTGGLIGIVGTLAYFRVEPLGVTSQLGSISRTILDNNGLLAERLNGLDTFAGCATQVVQTITENGWLIGGLVIGSFAVSLVARKISFSRVTVRGGATALLGGVAMGWGSMLALGCTVGTLLSGISAFAISGWVFAAAMFAGVWLGIRFKMHTWT